MVVAWWVRAGRGSTLTRLHHDWRTGTTLRGVLTAGRHMGLLGLACIFSTLVMVDGPLLQRSSTVVTGPVLPHPVALNVTMAPEIPRYWSGNWATGAELGAADERWTPDFNTSMPAGDRNVSNEIWCATNHGIEAKLGRLYFNDAPLVGVFTGCRGRQCRAVLRAPALAQKTCVTRELPVDYGAGMAHLQLQSLTTMQRSAFFIANALIPQQRESIALNTAFSETTACKGMLTMTSCEFVAAVGDYNVTIDDDRATLDAPARPTIVAIANNTAANATINAAIGARDSTLAGLVKLHWDRWVASMQMSYIDGITSARTVNSPTLDSYMQNATSDCPFFTDAHEDDVASLNKLMVYAGLVAAQEGPA